MLLFSHSAMSNSLRPHELQHARLSCPSPSPGAYSNSYPLNPVMPSNHLILCHPLLLLPSILPGIRVFSNESPLHIRWPKYWNFDFSIRPSNEHPGLMDLPQDGLVGTPCSPRDSQESFPTPQFKSIILQHSAFFIVQLSNPYMTTGKTIALTRRTFISKVMSLLLNMLSRLVTAFLPRSKHLNFMAAVTIHSDFGAQKNKVCLFPLFSHLFAMKWWDWMT